MNTEQPQPSWWYSLPLAARIALQALIFAALAVGYRFATSFIWDKPRWETSLVVLLAVLGALVAYFDDRGRRWIEHELDRVANQPK